MHVQLNYLPYIINQLTLHSLIIVMLLKYPSMKNNGIFARERGRQVVVDIIAFLSE